MDGKLHEVFLKFAASFARCVRIKVFLDFEQRVVGLGGLFGLSLLGQLSISLLLYYMKRKKERGEREEELTF